MKIRPGDMIRTMLPLQDDRARNQCGEMFAAHVIVVSAKKTTGAGDDIGQWITACIPGSRRVLKLFVGTSV